MLKKLVRYEWKSICKMEALLLVILVWVTLCGISVVPAFMDYFIPEKKDNMTEVIELIFGLDFSGGVMLYTAITTSVMLGNMIYLGIHFYKSMYTDEGHLTHTLPVTAHQLLGSKVLVGTLCTFIMNFITLCGSFAFVLLELLTYLKYNPSVVLSRLRRGKLFKGNGLHSWNLELGKLLLHYIISYGMTFLAGPFIGVCCLFGALTIGQLSKRYRRLMGIVAYMGLLFVIILINNAIRYAGVMLLNMSGDCSYGEKTAEQVQHLNQVLFYNQDIPLLIFLVIGVCLYFLSHFIIKWKLDLH